jgi:hypothetical protein
MALPAEDTEARLIGLLDRAEPKIRRALLQAVTAARAANTLDELAGLLEQGRFQEALDRAVRQGIIRLADEVTGVFVAAGQSGSAYIADALGVIVSFDQVNDRAVNVMRTERLRLIREFGAEQRRATREALVDGIRRGLNPIDQARNFRESIGLTTRQEQTVQNFRRMLEDGDRSLFTRSTRDRRFDAKIRSAFNSGRRLTSGEIDQMVTAFRRKSVLQRSQVIARTEALRATHTGNNEAFDQAIQDGLLDPGQLMRTWNTARDDRVRDSHSDIDGETIPHGDLFVTGLGNELQFPGDPAAPAVDTIMCRCVITTRIEKPKESQ